MLPHSNWASFLVSSPHRILVSLSRRLAFSSSTSSRKWIELTLLRVQGEVGLVKSDPSSPVNWARLEPMTSDWTKVWPRKAGGLKAQQTHLVE